MANTILIIDDDKELRAEFSEYFSEYTVIEAVDGATALKILKKPHEIDLVILDVRLPEMNGLEVLRRIKDLDPTLIIIIQTGFGSKDVAIEALQGNADDFIEKPFDPEKTRKVLEKHFAKKQKTVSGNFNQAEEIVQRITAYIQRNYLKKISLQDIANAVFLSPKYISRIFKEKLNMSIGDFKLQQKIKKAQELLLTTNDSIEQISDAIGYQNAESFIRLFKKLTAQTPTEFRHKKKVSKKQL
jgi:YesN/AraC family two-component response regulator